MSNRVFLIAVMLCLPLVQTGCEDEPFVIRSSGEACAETSECASNLCYAATCLEPDRDDDRDGLTNTLEAELGTDPFNYDSDGDGLSDFHEIPYLAEPADEDGDGVIDANESLTAETGSGDADPDNDCLPDQKDPDNATPIAEVAEFRNLACCCFGPCNKFGVTEDGQVKAGTGDTIEVLSANDCTEEVLESGDLECELNHEWINKDNDGDGIDNACDPCRDLKEWLDDDYPNDSDKDSVWDCEDNCPPVEGQDTWNGAQLDTDGDGQGDACDSDIDGDDVENEEDNCPYVSNPDQVDEAPQNGIGDACDPAVLLEDLDGDGTPNLLDCAPEDADYAELSCGPENTCGDNGCGSKCGTCFSDEVCTDNVCVKACVPNCAADDACGDDGCGGSCGSCGESEVCGDAGMCESVCTPNCAQEAACGDDGCGGTCGECTSGDLCVESLCDGSTCVSTSVDCDDENLCTTDSCDPSAGCVFNTALADGTPCDDTDDATIDDVCTEGVCQGVRPGETCAFPLSMTHGDTLTIDTCDYETLDVASECGLLGVDVVVKVDIPYAKATLILDVLDGPDSVFVEGVGGASCEPLWGGALCKPVGGGYQIDAWESDGANTFRIGTTDESCGEVTLALSLECDCNDANDCTVDTCGDDGACLHEPVASGQLCDDQDPCTIADACDGAGLCSGAAVSCVDPGPCASVSCVDGGCVVSPFPEGSPCDDGSACTTSDVCSADGACVGAPVDCDDNDPCTVDQCEPGDGEATCVSSGVGDLCSDSDLDEDPCTVRVCDIPGASEWVEQGATDAEGLCAEIEVTQASPPQVTSHAEEIGCECQPSAAVAVIASAAETFCAQICTSLDACGVETCESDCISEVSQDHRAARRWACHRETFVQSQTGCNPEIFAAQRASCEIGCEVAAPSECQEFCQAAEDCYPDGLALSEGVIAQTLGSFELCTAACQGLISVEPFARHDYQCVTEELNAHLTATVEGQACPAPNFGCGTRPCDLDEPTCHRWSTVEGGNGHYYDLVSHSSALSWSSARVKAKSATQGEDRQRYGGHLAVPSKPSEDAWLRSAVANAEQGSYWLGAYVPTGAVNPTSVPGWEIGEPAHTVTGEVFGPNESLITLSTAEEAEHFASYGPHVVGGEDIVEGTVALRFRTHESPVSGYIVEYPTSWGVCNDRDHDEVCNEVDLCIEVPDLLQEDADEDGVGDACDIAPGTVTSFLSEVFVSSLTDTPGLIESWCAAQCGAVVEHCNADAVSCNERCVSELQTPGKAELLSIRACEALAADPSYPGDCQTRSACARDGGALHMPSWLTSDLFVDSVATAQVRTACLNLCNTIEDCASEPSFPSDLELASGYMPGAYQSTSLCTETCVGHAAADPWRALDLLNGCAKDTWKDGCQSTELIPICSGTMCGDIPEEQCRQWTTAEGGNGHLYLLEIAFESKQFDTWLEELEGLETDLSTHMAVLSKQPEHAWVTEVFLGEDFTVEPFLGVTYSESAELWQWATGEPFSFDAWAEGEPDLEAGGAMVLTAGGWRAASEAQSLLLELSPTLGADDDQDEVPDTDDNCPGVPNQPQRDLDGDGLGDPCDECPNGIIGWTSNPDTDANGNGCMDVGEDLIDTDGDGDPDLTDCSPSDASVYTGAEELCDNANNDCDTQIDEGFLNTDGDGLADCVDPDDDGDGVEDSADCDPLNPEVFVMTTFFPDADGDGFGSGAPEGIVYTCAGSNVSGYVTNDLDCNDVDSSIKPNVLDVCNGIDDNCNGPVDEDCDNDGDGVIAGSDADDDNPLICSDLDDDSCDDCSQGQGLDTANDGLDTDGDGICDLGDSDDDDDGFSDAVDCDPFDKDSNPDADELCDNVDNDCDNLIDEDFNDPGLDCNQDPCLDGYVVCQAGQCIGALQESPVCGVACTGQGRLVASVSPAGRSEIHALEVVGDRAYVGTESGLEIYDVSDPRSRRLLGFFATHHPVTTVAVGPFGDPVGATAYLALGTEGMLAVDVRVPGAPKLTSQTTNNAGSPIDDIVVGPGAVYVAIGAKSGLSNLTLWTFKDSAGCLSGSPEENLIDFALDQVGTRPRLALHGGQLYLLVTGGEGPASAELRVYDTGFTAPWHVTHRGTWLIGNTDVVDIAVRSQWVEADTPSGGEVQPVLYLTASDAAFAEPMTSSESGFFAPEDGGTQLEFDAHIITGADWVVASGEVGMGLRLFVRSSNGALVVIDEVSAASGAWTMSMLSAAFTADARAIAVSGHIAHLIDAGARHVVMRVADAEAVVDEPQDRDILSSGYRSIQNAAERLALTGFDRLYEISWAEFLGSDMDAPSLSSHMLIVEPDQAVSVSEVTRHVSVVLRNDGVLELFRRTDGALLGGVGLPFGQATSGDLALSGDYVLATGGPDATNTTGLALVRLPEAVLYGNGDTDWQDQPQQLEPPELSYGWQVASVSTDGHYAYLGLINSSLEKLGLRVVDISNPEAPTFVGELTESAPLASSDFPVVSMESTVVNQRVYITAQRADLTVITPVAFDVSSVTNPVEVDLDLPPMGRLTARGGYLYGTNRELPGSRTVVGWSTSDPPDALVTHTLANSSLMAGGLVYDWEKDALTLTPQGLAQVVQNSQVARVRVHQFEPCGLGASFECAIKIEESYDVTRGQGYKVAVSQGVATVLEVRDEGETGFTVFDVSDEGAVTPRHRSPDYAATLTDVVMDAEHLMLASTAGFEVHVVGDAGVSQLGEMAAGQRTAIDYHEGELASGYDLGDDTWQLKRAELSITGGGVSTPYGSAGTQTSSRIVHVDHSGGPIVATRAGGGVTLWDSEQDEILNWHPDFDSEKTLDAVASPSAVYALRSAVNEDEVTTLWLESEGYPNAEGAPSNPTSSFSGTGSSEGLASTPLVEDAGWDYLARYEGWLAILSESELIWASLADPLAPAFGANMILPHAPSGGMAIEGPRVYVTSADWPLQVVDLACAPGECSAEEQDEVVDQGLVQYRCDDDALVTVDACGQQGQPEMYCSFVEWGFCVGCPSEVRKCSADAACVVVDPSTLAQAGYTSYVLEGDPANTLGCDPSAGAVDRELSVDYDAQGNPSGATIRYGQASDAEEIATTWLTFNDRQIGFSYPRSVETDAGTVTVNHVVTLSFTSPYAFAGTDLQTIEGNDAPCTDTLGIQGTRTN